MKKEKDNKVYNFKPIKFDKQSKTFISNIEDINPKLNKTNICNYNNNINHCCNNNKNCNFCDFPAYYKNNCSCKPNHPNYKKECNNFNTDNLCNNNFRFDNFNRFINNHVNSNINHNCRYEQNINCNTNNNCTCKSPHLNCIPNCCCNTFCNCDNCAFVYFMFGYLMGNKDNKNPCDFI